MLTSSGVIPCALPDMFGVRFGAHRLPNEAVAESSSAFSLPPSDCSHAAEPLTALPTGDPDAFACDVVLTLACAQGRHAVVGEVDRARFRYGGFLRNGSFASEGRRSSFPAWVE